MHKGLFATVVSVLAVALVSTAVAQSSSAITPPASVKSAGKIVWCSDVAVSARGVLQRLDSGGI